jgi:1,4-alpha-glucan branching enzyme
MGWMHDTLRYMADDPVYRKYHHGELTFRMIYAFNENFVLPLSHDEVVYGKGSLINKMPGDDWQKFANLRLLYSMQWAQPGKKLLFMGCELAEWREWNHEGTLDWSLHDRPPHDGIRRLIADLNACYRHEPAMHRGDGDHNGLRWVESADSTQSVYAWLRIDPTGEGRPVLVVVNATPVPRHNYRLGVPTAGGWLELLNTDAEAYGGSGVGNYGEVETVPVDSHGYHRSLVLTLPPLATLFLAPSGK